MIATFVTVTLLTETPSNVTLADKLPTIIVIVAPTHRVRSTPDAVLSVTLLLDTHCVAAELLTSSCNAELCSQTPAPDPTTVTLNDPVVATFDRRVELNDGPSIVNEAVKLPSCIMTVAMFRNGADTEAAGRNRRPLVDTQSVIAAPVPPTRTRFVPSCSNVFEPTTVTLCAPVTAPFVAITSDGAGPLYDTPNVTVRDGASVVTVTRRECCAPEAALLVSAVDDRHHVVSASLLPMRNNALDVELATFRPTSVTLIAPVDAKFVTVVELGSTTSNVTTDETVPVCNPAVDTVRREGDMPIDTRPCIALVDTHRVDAKALPPTRPTALNANSPTPT